MSLLLRRKQQHENGETTKENVETTKENISTFSYNVARPLLRREDHFVSAWNVKGYMESIPEKKYEISYNTIRSALFQIREHTLRTPCCQSLTLLDNKHYRLFLKRELNQITNSVKARGVAYTLLQLSDEQKREGVIAVSTGSFASTLCYYGKKFGIPVTVVMPTSTAYEKVKMCRDHADSQASVIVLGSDVIEAHYIALNIAMNEDLFYLDGNNHPNMIIGQATLGLEMMEQMTNIDAVVLPTPIDDCRLTASIARTIKGWRSNIKIIEVQKTGINPSIQDRRQTTSFHELEIPMRGHVMYMNSNSIQESLIDRLITVDEISIRTAAKLLLNKENIIDSCAALGLAAFLTHQLDELNGKKVIIPLFGEMDFD